MKSVFSCLLAFIATFYAQAQNLSVNSITITDKPTIPVEFPLDLNGNKCALVEINLNGEGVAFEGNVIGAPIHSDGLYQLFLTQGSKYLGIKYPGESPILLKLKEYGISELPPLAVLKIDMTEPSQNLAENLNSKAANVSDEAEELYEKGELLLSKQDLVAAFDYFIKADELGHPKAAYQLGYIYTDPFKITRKKVLGNSIGEPIQNPVKQDWKKAYEYYRKSAEAGFVLAQFAVGECLEKGKGVKKNKEEALIWYQKAAEQGHMPAKDKMGDNVKKNRIFGVFVASYGTSENEFIINSIDTDPNDLSAIANGRKDKNGQFCALVKVVLPFDNVDFVGDTIGKPIFKTNEYWVYLPHGTKTLGINYPDFLPAEIKFKQFGINQIESKSTYQVSVSFPIELLRDYSSMTAEDYYKIGKAFIDRSDIQYLRWMAKAAELDHPQALQIYGTACVFGTGVKKNKLKGVQMLQKAFELGNAEAAFALGTYYELEGKKDQAQLWFDMAAEKGCERAKGRKAKNLGKSKILFPF